MSAWRTFADEKRILVPTDSQSAERRQYEKNQYVCSSLDRVLFIAPDSGCRRFSPIVSTDWLHQNLDNPKLIIVDIRKVEDYRTGHIPGPSVSSMGRGPSKRAILTISSPRTMNLSTY
jgi:hypothetical protein